MTDNKKRTTILLFRIGKVYKRSKIQKHVEA